MNSMATNWKTTAAGLASIAMGIAPFFGIPLPFAVDPATSILGGIGLIFAKDFNVTGGTKPQ